MSILASARAWVGSPRARTPASSLAIMRVLCGAYAVVWMTVRLPYLVDLTRQPRQRWDPVGVWGVVGDAPPSGVMFAGFVATILLGIAFTLGWHHRVVGPVFAAAALVVLSFTTSWGQILHTEHLVALYLLVLGFSPAADALALGSRSTRSARHVSAESDALDTDALDGDPSDTDALDTDAGNTGAARYRRPLQLMMLVAALTYFVAGYAKVRGGGVEWVTGDVLRNQIAHDNMRKDLMGDPSSPFAPWLVRQHLLFPPMALGSMVLELGAPLAVFLPRLRRWWAAGVWVFHLAILAFMAVLFPFQLLGIALAPIFLIDRGTSTIESTKGRATMSGSATGGVPMISQARR